LSTQPAAVDGRGIPWSPRGMIVLRAVRRRIGFLLGPVLGIALTGYFAYHLVEGDRGFKTWLSLNREIRTSAARLDAVRAQRAALDLKVSNLRPEHVDPDLLDERIRATLNLVSPDDIVIMQPAVGR
jgi:cell division protein FtsB